MSREKIQKALEHASDVRIILHKKTVASMEDYVFIQGAYWKEMRAKIEATLAILESLLEDA